MLDRAAVIAVFALSLALGACAETRPDEAPTATLASPAPAATSTERATYTLSSEEAALDCKRLTGRLQVRLLQIRDVNRPRPPSEVGQTIQQSVAPVLGGGSRPALPAEQAARDRAQVEAYNRQLAAKGCPTFDIEAELKATDPRRTPTPQLPAAKRP